MPSTALTMKNVKKKSTRDPRLISDIMQSVWAGRLPVALITLLFSSCNGFREYVSVNEAYQPIFT
jgi:hypothetical protein